MTVLLDTFTSGKLAILRSRVFNKRLILCIGKEEIIVVLMYTPTSLTASAPTKEKVNLRFMLNFVRLVFQVVVLNCLIWSLVKRSR